MSQNKTYSIGELANEFGITTRSVRFYEDQGLLTPYRHGRTRIFNAESRARLQLILRNKRMGFSLAEARELFDLFDDIWGGNQKQLMTVLEILHRRRAKLAQQKSDIQKMEVEMDAAETRCREALDNLQRKKQRHAS